ncbi:unnamed protein product [Caenorhabditis bovis]|uniref:Uncharacterized protein n=1 Tax=Caenorhabditis bovis TaxID=2654633 RepID=A0A8S1EZ77_9PELO|nr:unnamed protein product [Caenorhabditis bovis]
MDCSLLVSLAGLAPTIRFIAVKLMPSMFHANLKGFHVIAPILVGTIDCEHLIGPAHFQLISYPLLYLFGAPVLITVAITIERLIALFDRAFYENRKIGIGPMLLGITLTINMIIIYIVFRNEAFQYSTFNFFLIPPSSASSFNLLIVGLFLINVGNFATNLALARFLQRFNSKTASLSTRYLIEELHTSTNLTIGISFLHNLFFAVHLIDTFAIRFLLPLVVRDATLINGLRGIMLVLPVYNLLAGVIAAILMKRLNWQKSKKRRQVVSIEYSGVQGAKNHDAAIQNCWNFAVEK